MQCLRGTAFDHHLTDLLENDAPIALVDIVHCEILQGIRDDDAYLRTRASLLAHPIPMERALAGWSTKEMRSRWRDDAFPWIGQFTRAWVQRRSMLHARPTRSGIRITLDTKDDRGYYHYGFEGLPEPRCRQGHAPQTTARMRRRYPRPRRGRGQG